MKRCPQCEFIYEDDQSLCDMDGALLVLDSRSLPNLHALTTVDVPVAAQKGHWRHRTFPALAALILASVFSLVYFVSTQRGGASSAPVTVPAVTLPASSLVPPAHLNPTPEPPTVSQDTAAVPANETKTQTKAPATPSAKAAVKATSKISTTQRKPVEEKKEESKVGSILKKTGRILKKPFKL